MYCINSPVIKVFFSVDILALLCFQKAIFPFTRSFSAVMMDNNTPRLTRLQNMSLSFLFIDRKFFFFLFLILTAV